MTVQAQWNDCKFSITSKQLKTLDDIGASYKITKKTDGTTSKTTVNGHELESFSLSYKVSPQVGVDPLNEYIKMRAYLGKYAPLLVENALFGPNNLMLEKVSLSADSISSTGVILSGTITLDLKEYQVEGRQTKPKASIYTSPIKKTKVKETAKGIAEIALKILYNGKDITQDVDISSCIHDMFASSEADTLIIKFNDAKHLWDSWKPEKKDTISVSYGIAKTGNMFVYDISPENGIMTLKASSVPKTSKNKTDKSWENVHLLQLVQEVAKRHGLGFESYDVDDKIYNYVRQPKIPDFEFLQQRCNLESLAFVVFDKKLVLYDEEKLEKAEPVKEIKLAESNDFTYTDSSQKGYGISKVINGALTGTYQSSNGLANELTNKISIVISGQAEANRFAKGLLRQENKTLTKGVFKYPMLREFSAGSVVKISTTGANSWNGNAFIHHIRQDYVKATSKVFFRKTVL